MTERSRGIAVAGAHRTVRALAEGEGPFAGELVTRGEGVAVRVDTAQLAGWPGWGFAGAEHVAAPEDLALRADGQDALLPWCVRSAEVHLAQRAEQGGLANGEAVTLAVSVLRGLVELDALEGADDDRPGGRWWLTDEGRPVFVIGPGDSPLAESGRLIDALEERTEDRTLSRVLARFRAALEEPRRLRAEAARWEQELLEVAAPRPLRAPDVEEGIGPVRVREMAERTRSVRRRDLRGSGRVRARVARNREKSLDRRGRWRLHLPVDDVAAGWAALRGRLPVRAPQKPERTTERGRRWRGPALVAVSAAVVVAVLGAVWPGGSSATPAADAADRRVTASASPRPTGTADASESSSSPADSAAPTTRPERSAGPSREQDPLAAATDLIAAAQHCGHSPAPGCVALWDGGGSAAGQIRGDKAPPVLIEDYGDIAAVRNPADDGAQMIVIIRRDGEWRIRDVYDIADPPSDSGSAP